MVEVFPVVAVFVQVNQCIQLYKKIMARLSVFFKYKVAAHTTLIGNER